MKYFVQPTLSFRPLPTLCLLACCLTLLTSPATAAELSGKKQEVPSEQTVLTELADRVRDRALFAAKVAPEVSRIVGSHRGNGYVDPDILIDSLWQLRSTPKGQKEWLNKLAATDLTEAQKKQLLQDLELLMDHTHYRAKRLLRYEPRQGNLWTWFHRNFMGIDGPYDYWNGPKLEMPFMIILNELDHIKALEKTFADALVLTEIYSTVNIDPHIGEPYAKYLLELKDRPEDLKLAVDCLHENKLSWPILKALLATLVKDPDKARAEIADLNKPSPAKHKTKRSSR